MARTQGEPRPEKAAKVQEIEIVLKEAASTLLVEMSGMTVAEAVELRHQFRERDVRYKVYKNTFIRIAASNLGIEGIEEHLKGPTALATAADPSAAMKTLREYMKTNEKVRVKAGLLGLQALNEADAAALADLPSREESIAQLAGLLQSPTRGLAVALNQISSGLAVALNQILGGLSIALRQVAEQSGQAAE